MGFFRNILLSSATNGYDILPPNSPESGPIEGNLQKATWRVRAALVYKNINYDEVSINIVGKDEGWVDYQKKINPMGFVPSGSVSNWSHEVDPCLEVNLDQSRTFDF